ncbi:MAG TPA: hypothetical protein VJJ22_01850 [Candidatus Paceibacterota bacterium]
MTFSIAATVSALLLAGVGLNYGLKRRARELTTKRAQIGYLCGALKFIVRVRTPDGRQHYSEAMLDNELIECGVNIVAPATGKMGERDLSGKRLPTELKEGEVYLLVCARSYNRFYTDAYGKKTLETTYLEFDYRLTDSEGTLISSGLINSSANPQKIARDLVLQLLPGLEAYITRKTNGRLATV